MFNSLSCKVYAHFYFSRTVKHWSCVMLVHRKALKLSNLVAETLIARQHVSTTGNHRHRCAHVWTHVCFARLIFEYPIQHSCVEAIESHHRHE